MPSSAFAPPVSVSVSPSWDAPLVIDCALGTIGMKNLGAPFAPAPGAFGASAPEVGTPPGSTGARSVLLLSPLSPGASASPGAALANTSTYRLRTCDMLEERDTGLDPAVPAVEFTEDGPDGASASPAPAPARALAMGTGAVGGAPMGGPVGGGGRPPSSGPDA